MKLDFAFLADAATMLPDGTFDVIRGGSDAFTGRSFPAFKPTIVLIARILFSPEECGKTYEFVADIFNKDEQSVFKPIGGSISPPPHQRHPDRANWITFALSFNGVKFPAPGDYFVRLSIGEQVIAEATLEVHVEEDNPT